MRAKFVAPNAALLVSNEGFGVRWMHWNGTALEQRSIINPLGRPVGSANPLIVRVSFPDYAISGSRLIAVVSDDDQPGVIYGLLDDKPNSNDSQRFRWTEVATLPGPIHGLASWDGHTVIASIRSSTASGQYFRISVASGTVSSCDSSKLVDRGPERWMSFIGPDHVVGIDDYGIVISTDLTTWSTLNTPASSIATGDERPWSMATDPFPNPPGLYIGSRNGVWVSHDLAKTWTSVLGLPTVPIACQLEVVVTGSRRVLNVGTWNWSAWAADLQ